MKDKTPREITADMLVAVYKEKRKSHLVLKETLKKYSKLDLRDKNFIVINFKGVLENQIKCDFVISKFSKTKVNKIKPLVLCVLRIAAYEMLFLSDIPAHAIVNESVNIVKGRGLKGLVPYTNGVLRSLTKEISNIKLPKIDYKKSNDDLIFALSINYSIPKWLVEHMSKEYDFDTLVKIYDYYSQKNDITLRIDKNKVSASKYLEMLSDYNKSISGVMQFGLNKYIDYAINLKKVRNIEELPGYKEGLFFIQDISSMIVGEIASKLYKNDSELNILDLCASPGGKSIHLSQIFKNSKITSCDKSEGKLVRLNENIKRTKSGNVKAIVNDATQYNKYFEQKFDLIVVDAPCSGLGVIGSKADIKNNLNIETFESLQNIQKDILHQAIKYLKSGGYLIYSTCTLEKKENYDNLAVLLENSNIEKVNLSEIIPEKLKDEWNSFKEIYCKKNNISTQNTDCFLQIVPGINDMSGFFICAIKKK